MATYESIGNLELIGDAKWDTSLPNGFDSGYSPDGMLLTQTAGIGLMTVRAVTNELWVHVNVYKHYNGSFTSGDKGPLIIYDDNNNELLEIRSVNNGENHRIYYRVGGVLTDSGVTITWTAASAYSIMDFHITTNATTGSYEIYQDQVLVWSVYNIDSGIAPIKYCKLRSSYWGTLSSDYRVRYGYSEMVFGIGNSPTVGKRVFNAFATGDSATNTAWNGTFAEIDDPLSIGDGSYVYTDTPGIRSGFTLPALPSTNASIDAVGMSTTAFIGVGSPLDLSHSFRLAGTDYDQAAISATTIPLPHETILQFNPNTTNPWTIAEVNSTEFGVISI